MPRHSPTNSTLLWEHDCRFCRDTPGVVGVDEAGRGCLAGPVFAAAVHLPASFFKRPWPERNPPPIDDSKKLTCDQRNGARAFLERLRREKTAVFAIGTAGVEEIESLNILGATTLAMRRALASLGVSLLAEDEDMPLWEPLPERANCPRVLVDGRPLRNLGHAHQALVGGDGTSLAIALASVLAKVERDVWMEKAHNDHPSYGWATNRGYGTKAHIDALRAHGPTPLHRESFLQRITRKPGKSL